jgi:hypothetical protein
MPLLLYCVTEDRVARPKTAGVRGGKVDCIVGQGLHCFFSTVDELDELQASETVREDALQFHAVISELFSHAAVIPFRYPTVVESALWVAEFLEEHASGYRATLASHRDDVQMDVRLLLREPHRTTASSGKEFLEHRRDIAQLLETAASTCRERVGAVAVRWRQRPTREGLRCFALVRRAEVRAFQQHIQSVELPESVKAVVSGPWPTTEFLNSSPQ